MNRPTAAEWKELSALYEQADELDGAALSAFLNQLRAAECPVLLPLEHMLHARSQIRDSDFLAEPPALIALPTAQVSDWSPGQTIGPYTLQRALGAGGMAEVWLAKRTDGAFDRSFAIKLMYRDASRTRRSSFVQRFERERDILASLNHRNIANLLDAGITESGQPWIALAYVEGQALTEWCDARSLTISARVRLFLQVLLAVQYAHANLVIHRDLKPNNILVTAQGQVQLLDFGIAKILEPESKHTTETELTQVIGRSLTLLYASPEQVRALPLTTASDVYSLGVVLYEVLCGETPYELRRESPAQLEQAILELEPRPPSRRNLSEAVSARRATTPRLLRKQLANDLDAIVLKALHKQAELRYASVEALRTDLQLWLDGQAVLAKPPSSAYYLRKFVARHRVGVALGSVALLALLAATSAALWFGLQAQQESQRASASRDFLIDMFRQADPDLAAGQAVSAKTLLDQAQHTLQTSMKGQPLLQAQLLHALGLAQRNMSDYVQAERSLGESLRRYQSLGQAEQAAHVLVDQAFAVYMVGDFARAENLVAAFAQSPQLAGASAQTLASYQELSGLLASNRGDRLAAKQFYLQALDNSTAALGALHETTLRRLSHLGRVEASLGDYASAAQHLADAGNRLEQVPNVNPLQPKSGSYPVVGNTSGGLNGPRTGAILLLT